ESIVRSVVEPTICDLRTEYLHSDRAGARFIAYMRGAWAFWSLVAIAPFVFSRIPRRADMTVAARVVVCVVLLAIGPIAGFMFARKQPVLYQSSAVIQVVPARVPEGVVRPAGADTLAERLQQTQFIILSRTRLERLIRELDLYPSERKTKIMEDVVALMLRNIQITPSRGDVFRITYSGSNPTATMKATERLAAYFIEESLKEAVRRSDGTLSVLEARIQETGQRLAALGAELERAGNGAQTMPKRLELEVIQGTYKNLLTRREEALGMRDLDRRQIGEQYNLLDPARVPERPIGPSQITYALMGGVAGLAAAVLMLLLDAVRRTLVRRRNLAGNVA